MTGVTWRELAPDVPEPPPLSVVRDNDADEWVRLDKGWLMLGDDDAQPCTWSHVSSAGPLQLAERADDLTWVPGEVLSVEPSDYEIRLEALRAATCTVVPADNDDMDAGARVAGMTRAIAREFEEHLRGEDPGREATDESAGTDAAWYQAREDAERAEARGGA